MSDGMGRELAYLSSHATNRYFIPNWGLVSKIPPLLEKHANIANFVVHYPRMPMRLLDLHFASSQIALCD